MKLKKMKMILMKIKFHKILWKEIVGQSLVLQEEELQGPLKNDLKLCLIILLQIDFNLGKA